MPVYSSTQQLEEVMATLFQRMTDAGLMDSGGHKMRIKINLTDPSAGAVLDLRKEPARALFGAAPGPFDLQFTMPADTIHRIWLGQAGVRQSMAAGELKVHGNPLKALSLRPIFENAKQIYPQVIKEYGITTPTS
ncbi:MAG: SCP2 sterol-binding domain-containing protein [Anaerolineae bacterium]